MPQVKNDIKPDGIAVQAVWVKRESSRKKKKKKKANLNAEEQEFKKTNKKINYTTESFELYPKLRVKFKLVAEKS